MVTRDKKLVLVLVSETGKLAISDTDTGNKDNISGADYKENVAPTKG